MKQQNVLTRLSYHRCLHCAAATSSTCLHPNLPFAFHSTTEHISNLKISQPHHEYSETRASLTSHKE